jgi:hypothetical protein
LLAVAEKDKARRGVMPVFLHSGVRFSILRCAVAGFLAYFRAEVKNLVELLCFLSSVSLMARGACLYRGAWNGKLGKAALSKAPINPQVDRNY